MGNRAVSDTGPFIHLTEIEIINYLNIFSNIFITEEVAGELKKHKISVPKTVKVKQLSSYAKDNSILFINQQNLDLGEASAIALALQEKADYFLTDDLDARRVAEEYFIEVHGSVGIIMRALKDKIISKKTAIKKIIELYDKSSLFITRDIVNIAIKSIEDF